MSKLLERLQLFDLKIAAIYKDGTGDGPRAKINKATAQKLIDQVLDDKTLSDKEGSALHQLFAFAKFDDDAMKLIIERLEADVIAPEAFEKSRPSASLSKRIAYALSTAVTSRIQFVSPYTNIAYSPAQYTAVSQLIDKNEIEVWAIPAGSAFMVSLFGEGEASYRTDLDRMWLPDWDFDFPLFNELVVHEATHAIQDWLDQADLYHWHTETDAYIAGAIAAFTLKIKSDEPKTHPGRVAENKLSDLLKNNKPLSGPKFNEACKAVYKAVKVFEIYKDKKDAKYGLDDKKRTVSEKDMFQKLYQAALSAAAKP